MNSLNNIDFKKLLDDSTLESSMGKVSIYHEEEVDFSFTYKVGNDSIELNGFYKLTGEQTGIIKDAAYDYYLQNKSEDSNDAFSNRTNHMREYGLDNQMFI